ncbi:MAG: hypothetical protein M3P16_01190 [Chloroflexota bacterium]|nr:hypothetical protein [Chloroflexota bacterium]
MADAKGPKCPECGAELEGAKGAALQALKIEYRNPGPHPTPESRTVDAIYCLSCGRLFTVLAHPGVA